MPYLSLRVTRLPSWHRKIVDGTKGCVSDERTENPCITPRIPNEGVTGPGEEESGALRDPQRIPSVYKDANQFGVGHVDLSGTSRRKLAKLGPNLVVCGN